MDARSEKPQAPVRPWAVLAVVGVGTFLAALAGSAVNLALPALGRDLGISIEASRWIILAFLLAVGVLALVAGRLADILGHKRIYLAGFVLFGAASVACGLVDGLLPMVLLRVLQGVGGALLMAPGPALLTMTFPGRMRGRALGMVATATYLGLTIGPPLGGVIVDALGWRWTFFINGPVALVVLLLGIVFLPGRAQTTSSDRGGEGFDWGGSLTLLIGLPLFMLAISRGQHWGPAAWQTWASLGGGVLALVAFFWIQTRVSSPLLDLGLFRSRIFLGAVLSALANYIALFAMILLMPFFLVEGLGRSSSETGLLLSVHPLVMALVTSPSGWLSDRLGSRGLATLGMGILAVGLVGLSRLGSTASTLEVVCWLATVGLGTGVFISPNSSALMGAAPRNRQGTAGSMLAESRVLGMLVGVALSSAVFRAVGGVTGHRWGQVEFLAFGRAELVAAGVAALGALAAALRGRQETGQPNL